MNEKPKTEEKHKYKLSFFAQPAQSGTFGEKVDNVFKNFGKIVDKFFSPSTYINFIKNLFRKN